MLNSFLDALESTSFATAIREGLYLFPLLESAHVVGLALVFGTIAVVDFRLLGLASVNRPFEKVASEMLRWTWVAFALTLVTGFLMFSTNANVYIVNTAFRVKMVMLLLAGINMGIFELTTGRRKETWNTARSTPPAAKAAAVISLVIWLSVICLGRWIGFTITRSVESEPAPDINFDSLFPGSPEETPPAPPAPASEQPTQPK